MMARKGTTGTKGSSRLTDAQWAKGALMWQGSLTNVNERDFKTNPALRPEHGLNVADTTLLARYLFGKAWVDQLGIPKSQIKSGVYGGFTQNAKWFHSYLYWDEFDIDVQAAIYFACFPNEGGVLPPWPEPRVERIVPQPGIMATPYTDMKPYWVLKNTGIMAGYLPSTSRPSLYLYVPDLDTALSRDWSIWDVPASERPRWWESTPGLIGNSWTDVFLGVAPRTSPAPAPVPGGGWTPTPTPTITPTPTTGVPPVTTPQQNVLDDMMEEVERLSEEPEGLDPVIDDAVVVKALEDRTASGYTGPEAFRKYVITSEPVYFPQVFGTGPNRITDIDILWAAMAPPDGSTPKNVLLLGATGLGKTTVCQYIAYLAAKPYFNVNLNGGTTVEDLVGSWVPTAEKGFAWNDGVMTNFMRPGGVGGIFVVEEINAAQAEILFVLHSVLDTNRKIVLTGKDGEVVEAHPEFFFVATMNPDYEGTSELNAALFDRFDVVLEFTGKNVRRIFSNEKNGWAEEGLMTFYEKVVATIESGDTEGILSTRGLKQFIWNRDNLGLETAKMILLEKFVKGTNREAVQAYFDSL